MSEVKEEKKSKMNAILEQFSGVAKVLKSSRIYVGVGTYLANRQVLKMATEVNSGVTVTLIICFTLLGLAYIASETIRKK